MRTTKERRERERERERERAAKPKEAEETIGVERKRDERMKETKVKAFRTCLKSDEKKQRKRNSSCVAGVLGLYVYARIRVYMCLCVRSHVTPLITIDRATIAAGKKREPSAS